MMINLSNCHLRGGRLQIVYERPQDLDGLVLTGNVFSNVEIKTTYKGQEHRGIYIPPRADTWWERIRNLLTADKVQW
jgi:hypothetical protein